jgi:hypothetical protein
VTLKINKVNTTSPAGAKTCIATRLGKSYGHKWVNGGINSDASTLKGNPLAKRDENYTYDH